MSVHYNTPVEAEEEEQYVPERAVDKRLRGLRLEYLIKWRGYDDSENTWESISGMSVGITFAINLCPNYLFFF